MMMMIAMLLVNHVLTWIMSQTLCSAAPSQPTLAGQCGACCHDNTFSALPSSHPNGNNAVLFLEGNHMAMLLVNHILTSIMSKTLCSAAPSQPTLVGQCGVCCHDDDDDVHGSNPLTYAQS